MEYSPPPLFKQGAPARVKVTVFALISVALLVLDARMHALAAVRQVAATILYPFQVAALVPRDALSSMGDYFSSLSALQKEVRDLKTQQLTTAVALQQAQLERAENAQLRRLMEARDHLPVKAMLSEILYDARDPATRKVVLDRGARAGVQAGLPVIDNAGVVGQVTRVFPFTSEVTLLTDKEQAIPVQVLRSGLRSVAYGRGNSGLLDLRFVAPTADIQVGDVLVTSGLDGVYPAGLAVARVVQVESVGSGAFGRVVCQPLAGIERNRELLIVMSQVPVAPRPPAQAAAAASAGKHHLPKMTPVPLPPLAPAPLPPQQPAAQQRAAQTPAVQQKSTQQQAPAAGAAAGVAAPAARPGTYPAAAPRQVTPAAAHVPQQAVPGTVQQRAPAAVHTPQQAVPATAQQRAPVTAHAPQHAAPAPTQQRAAAAQPPAPAATHPAGGR